MIKAWLLKLHRWVALAFAAPLLVVIATGLILSFEPWIAGSAVKPGGLRSDQITALLAQHDPKGVARAISYRSYDGTLTIGGRGGTIVDVASGTVKPEASPVAQVLTSARRIHETLLLDLGWLVISSSVAMVVLALFGVFMGWPRISNSVGGWHQAMSWGLLPLLVLSPVTGILLAAGLTFSGVPGPGPQAGPPLKLAEAVRVAGQRHDLAGLVWLRPARGQMQMRIIEDGEYKIYRVSQEGAVAAARNWPRLWHEGTFAGGWSALMNVVISMAMLGLLATGVWIWARRKLRLRSRRAGRVATP